MKKILIFDSFFNESILFGFFLVCKCHFVKKSFFSGSKYIYIRLVVVYLSTEMNEKKNKPKPESDGDESFFLLNK